MLAGAEQPNRGSVHPALSIAKHLPELELHNSLGLRPPVRARRSGSAMPSTVAAPYDCKDNIAAWRGPAPLRAVPARAARELYVGPLHSTRRACPSAWSTSPSPIWRASRSSSSLGGGADAELGPGDALYIPYMWWHGVAVLAPFNILVNYWWNGLPRC